MIATAPMAPWRVTGRLSESECRRCALIAAERTLGAIANGAMHRAGANPNPWLNEWGSVCAECLVARYHNVYWPANGNVGSDKRDGDVAGWQVRWTPREHGALLLREDDDPADAYILVTGRIPLLTIRGWITGADGVRASGGLEERRADMAACFYVPQLVLAPLDRGQRPPKETR